MCSIGRSPYVVSPSSGIKVVPLAAIQITWKGKKQYTSESVFGTLVMTFKR